MKGTKKKSDKPRVLIVLLTFCLIAAIAVAYVSLKLQCEVLAKEKVKLGETLDAKKNQRINHFAHIQQLSTEERIVPEAIEIGLIKSTETFAVITVSKEKINQLNTIIKSKYEK